MEERLKGTNERGMDMRGNEGRNMVSNEAIQ